jgi:hypothetical protein
LKSINNWLDLEEHGIKILTGEADRTSRRALCDLTDEGKSIVLSVFGIEQATLSPNWNSGSKWSMMLPYELYRDLAIFSLLHGKYRCKRVAIISSLNQDGTLRSNSEIVGLEGKDDASDWDEHIQFLTEAGFHVRVIKIDTGQPGEGTRATHAMTGRTV